MLNTRIFVLKSGDVIFKNDEFCSQGPARASGDFVLQLLRGGAMFSIEFPKMISAVSQLFCD